MLTVKKKHLPIELGELLKNACLNEKEIYDKVNPKNGGDRFPHGDSVHNHDVLVGKMCFTSRKPNRDTNSIKNNSIPISQTLNGRKIGTNSLELLHNMTFVGIARDPMNAGDLKKFLKDKKYDDNEVLMTNGRVNTEGKVNVKCFLPRNVSYGQLLKYWVPEYDSKENVDIKKLFKGQLDYFKIQDKKTERIEPFIVPADQEGLSISTFVKYSLNKPKKVYDEDIKLEDINDNEKRNHSLLITADLAQLAIRLQGAQLLYYLQLIGKLSLDEKEFIEIMEDLGMINDSKDVVKEKERTDKIKELNKFYNLKNLNDSVLKTKYDTSRDDMFKGEGNLEKIKNLEKNISNSVEMFDALYKNIHMLNTRTIIGRAAGDYNSNDDEQEIEIELIK
jgi:hypothetical protein